MGLEPTNGGFANPSVNQLRHGTKLIIFTIFMREKQIVIDKQGQESL